MFCSFGDTPKILRIYGTGVPVLPAEPGWPQLAAHFPARNGDRGADGSGADRRATDRAHERAIINRGGAGRADERAIIVVEADRIADSCGYAVPVMDFVHERDLLTQWADRKSPEQLVAYRAERNSVSIDGLPALG
jgi:hypothetical protein